MIMKKLRCLLCLALVCTGQAVNLSGADVPDVKEKSFDANNGVRIKVRMEGPYTADVSLQIVCYFKYTTDGAKRMSGAPIELDKKLGGVITSLRERGEFIGDQLETLLIRPPKNSIKANALLLVGLGVEENLSPEVLEAVGRVGLREASKLGASRVGFAPLIRDQGNSKLSAADVEIAVVKSMLLAYDTEKRMQSEGLANPFDLTEWIVEAGPAYFDETAVAVQTAIKDAKTVASQRSKESYRRP
jgi:hypothetical protein